jgi:trk system potassium uptake protein TrkH
MIMLMFIGASPGSTGGGIKTTTFAILIQSVKSTLKNETKVEFFERTIPSDIVVKSISITIISFLTVCLGVLLMMRFDSDKNFLAILFEVVSAFGTVGLSMGITSSLSVMGKLTIVMLMFIGRVGALTLVIAVAQRGFKKSGIGYPETKILIG